MKKKILLLMITVLFAACDEIPNYAQEVDEGQTINLPAGQKLVNANIHGFNYDAINYLTAPMEDDYVPVKKTLYFKKTARGLKIVFVESR